MRCLLLLLIPIAACASHTPSGPAPEPTAGDVALRCARSVAQSNGFRVRPADPRDPQAVVAERPGSGGDAGESIYVRLVPGVGSEEHPVLSATVQGPRLGSGASGDAQQTARRIENRCGGSPADQRS